MSIYRVIVLVGILAVVELAIASMSAFAFASNGFFKTPSGKIVCLWFTGEGGASAHAGVVCGVSTGLKPPIPKTGHPECAHLDYVGNRVFLPVTGRVQLLPCAGDAGPFADPAHTVFLSYGKTKRIAGITCAVATKGLTCHNADGHGFFLSLRGWRVF
jgi:hypothetical protein